MTVSSQEANHTLAKLLETWLKSSSSSSSSSCSEHDFVGAYVLACLALRKPRRYLCKVFKTPLLVIEDEDEASHRVSSTLGSFEGLLDVLDEAYILRRLGSVSSAYIHIEDASSIPIATIFNHFQLVGIKHNENNFVNISIIKWALGKLPFTLMLDYIPTPIEVLMMQATGRRVLTVFTSHTNLSKQHVGRLNYMSGSKIHARNAFDFSVHDMVSKYNVHT